MSATYNFGNLKNPSNTKSGIAEKLLIAPLAWFATIQTPVAPFTAKGDMITIKTGHVFATGKGWLEFYLAPQKNSLGYNPTGDRGLQSLNAKATIFLPGSYAEAHEAISQLLNVKCIGLVRDSSCGDGVYYQVGDECMPAYITPTFTSGTSADGTKGYNVELDADMGPIVYAPTDVSIKSQILADDDETASGE